MTDTSTPTPTLGWVIAYVDDPGAAIAFYEQTFGFTAEFVSPDNTYGQLQGSATKLAFAAYALGDANFPGGVQRAPQSGPPPNIEIVLATTEVDAVYARAVAAGCEALAEPEDKPHGQRVSYVRDPFGTLVEIASPI